MFARIVTRRSIGTATRGSLKHSLGRPATISPIKVVECSQCCFSDIPRKPQGKPQESNHQNQNQSVSPTPLKSSMWTHLAVAALGGLTYYAFSSTGGSEPASTSNVKPETKVQQVPSKKSEPSSTPATNTTETSKTTPSDDINDDEEVDDLSPKHLQRLFNDGYFKKKTAGKVPDDEPQGVRGWIVIVQEHPSNSRFHIYSLCTTHSTRHTLYLSISSYPSYFICRLFLTFWRLILMHLLWILRKMSLLCSISLIVLYASKFVKLYILIYCSCAHYLLEYLYSFDQLVTPLLSLLLSLFFLFFFLHSLSKPIFDGVATAFESVPTIKFYKMNISDEHRPGFLTYEVSHIFQINVILSIDTSQPICLYV